MLAIKGIPVVDIGCLCSNFSAVDKAALAGKGKEFVEALAEVGFVYLTNHGISESLINSAMEAGQRFFALNEDIKVKYQRDEKSNQGYSAINTEVLDVSNPTYELKESYNIDPGCCLFPDQDVKGFERTYRTLLDSLIQLVEDLLRLLEVGLDLEEKCLINKHKKMRCPAKENITTFRILQYPPVPSVIPINAIRCGAHTDYGTITLLLQDSTGGLEVKNAFGEWILADPIANAILINVGDLLEVMTEGKLKATEHRVPIMFDGREKLKRNSMAFFVHPDNDVIICPFGTKSNIGITALEHVQNMFQKTYK